MQNVMKASTDVERGRGHLKKAEDLATSSRKMKLILGGILGLVLLIVLLVILNEFGAFKSRCSLLDVNTLLDIVRNLGIFNHPFRIRPQSWLTPDPQKTAVSLDSRPLTICQLRKYCHSSWLSIMSGADVMRLLDARTLQIFTVFRFSENKMLNHATLAVCQLTNHLCTKLVSWNCIFRPLKYP